MDIEIYDKVKELEREIWKIKIALLKSGSIKRSKKSISLEGIWKGVEVTEEDIERAKKSLFPQDYDV
ncbi:MAG: hypothetical protein ACPLKX_07605 [Dictyoglomaceae bacterium]